MKGELETLLSSVRCLVLDMDDTLYLERDYVKSGFLAVGKLIQEKYDCGRFYQLAWAAFEAGGRGKIFNEVMEELSLPADSETISRLVTCYREHVPDISLLPDAGDCLERLDAGRLWVLTGGPPDSQSNKFTALTLPSKVSGVVYSGDLGEGYDKPHPRGFLLIEEWSEFGGDECVYIGDNPMKDFAGPRLLGWRTVRIRRPDSLHESVESNADVDLEIIDLKELTSCLESSGFIG